MGDGIETSPDIVVLTPAHDAQYLNGFYHCGDIQ
jgi:hypothetical protein